MIDWGALLTMIWASLAAGLVLVVAVSLTIRSVAASREAGRAGRSGTASGLLAVGVLCGLVCALAVAAGLVVVLDKG